jgi:hypothetical protein
VLTHQQAAENVPRDNFAILLTPWVVGSCDGSVHRSAEFNFYAATAVKSGDSE